LTRWDWLFVVLGLLLFVGPIVALIVLNPYGVVHG
jgi:hypothetical protein